MKKERFCCEFCRLRVQRATQVILILQVAEIYIYIYSATSSTFARLTFVALEYLIQQKL